MTNKWKKQNDLIDRVCLSEFCYHSIKHVNYMLITSYTGGGGEWIPPLLTLVLNSVSGIKAIVLIFGDFSKNLSHITFLLKFEGYGVFRLHGNGLFKEYFYEILSKIMLFSFTVNFSSDLNRK